MPTLSRSLSLMLWLSLVTSLVGQQPPMAYSPKLPDPGNTSAATQAQDRPELQTRYPRYELKPGDVLEVSFQFVPEFNRTLPVQPDGFITLPEIGDVHAEGETTSSLTQRLLTAYDKVLQQPTIAVVLKEFEIPHFIVAGEVNRPGKYELRADTTATEAVAVAGGFSGRAKHSQALLFRRVSADWVEVKKINLKHLYSGDYHEDIHLRAGDMLYVPQNTLSKIAPFMPRSSVGAYIDPTRGF